MRAVALALGALFAASAALAAPSLGFATDVDVRDEPARRLLLPLVRRHGDDEDEDEGHDEHAEMSMHGSHSSASSPHPPEDEHSHHNSHAAPLLELNETQILLHHSPDPPSYFDFDQEEDGKPALLYVHIALMILAFFVLLPLSIFLKAGRSALSIIPQTGFLATSILGLFFGQVYNGLTPNMYEKSSHTSWGWATMVLAVGLNVLDVARFLLRFTRWGNSLGAKLAGYSLSRQSEEGEKSAEEHDGVVFQLGDDDDAASEVDRLVSSPVEMSTPERTGVSFEDDRTAQWSNAAARHTEPLSRNHSTFSDSDTVFDTAGPDSLRRGHGDAHEVERPASQRQQLRKYGGLLLDFAERLLLILAYIEVCTGIIVWTGTCRERYLNGCLAHIIKGSIFLWYGLLTFGRYCGAFSALGWAWNRHPAKSHTIWTAEFVESLVIFVYGSTNTWMERMGKTGAYSVKDVQHISIAIMFWAAGALGMVLESRSIRAWLSTPAAQASGRSLNAIAPPASASGSFNPFPALCIGVTGAAMAAHHQTYQFQVEIHVLWGNLLAAFAVFRFLTYFFLYLRPPASILPSRPPTEALAALCLTSGGVVFILSTEQITFAAMRHHFDDMMAFLNLTVAAVLAWFFWIAVLFGIKGWALARNAPQSSLALRAKDVASP
ncbi:Tvs1p [Rhodotorula paludigena]|uniref:Tvs1p n=1 Tax=Rhodotorula paludigena TaxID=86838 RepID=UPI003178A365